MTKTITVLDSLIYGFSTAFTSFCASNGINLLVARMKEEVDYSLNVVKEAEAQKMTGVTETLKDGAKGTCVIYNCFNVNLSDTNNAMFSYSTL